jgi:hypothetical protein
MATTEPQHQWVESQEPQPVKNDGFFPDVDLSDVRRVVRLDGTVSNDRLLESIVVAMALTNRDLADWKQAQIDAGYTSLDLVPAAQINEASVLLSHYKRAVYYAARADLIERYRDFDTTGAGDRLADELADSISDARRNARWAVLDIVGRAHLTVELI